jgi:hypothetical protein
LNLCRLKMFIKKHKIDDQISTVFNSFSEFKQWQRKFSQKIKTSYHSNGRPLKSAYRKPMSYCWFPDACNFLNFHIYMNWPESSDASLSAQRLILLGLNKSISTPILLHIKTRSSITIWIKVQTWLKETESYITYTSIKAFQYCQTCGISKWSPLWREDGSVICGAICQCSVSLRTHNHTSLFHLRLLGSLSVASYGSQGLRSKYSYPASTRGGSQRKNWQKYRRMFSSKASKSFADVGKSVSLCKRTTVKEMFCKYT